MASASLVDDVIVLDVPYAENYLAKGTPGIRYHVHADEHLARPHYVMPLSWASCVTLRGVFGENLAVDAALVSWARMERDLRVIPSLELRDRLEPRADRRLERTAADLGYLRPYQVVGAAFLATAGSAILGDDMRVGKTPQAIAALRILGAVPALVVVPNSTKIQWEDEFAKFWPDARAEVVRGTASQRRKTIAKLVEPCPVHGSSPYVIPTARTTRAGSAGTATNEISEPETRTTPSGNDRTQTAGTKIQPTAASGSATDVGNISEPGTTSRSRSTKSASQSSEGGVRSAAAMKHGGAEEEGLPRLPSTTTTEQGESADFSAETATGRSERQKRQTVGSSEHACICASRPSILIINWEALRLHSRQEAFGSAVSLMKCEQHGGDVSVARCELHERELNRIKFRAVVADEAHRAAHPRAKQTRALWAVGWAADHRYALSGTSILDSPEDLWALMHLVAPEEATQKTTWIDRYCTVGFNGFAEEVTGLRPDTKDELFRYVDPRFLRRTREVVMPWLPETIPVSRTVELGPKQRKAYDQMASDMLAELEDGDTVYVTNALAKLTRLRQFASAYAFLDEDGNLKIQMPSVKVDAMLDIAEELGGKAAVVWAESRQLVEICGKALANRGFGVGYLTGSVDVGERAISQAAFQRGDLQFMCATIGAAGEGITLDRADVAVFLQRSFSLAKNRQAEDRIVGQETGPGLEIIDLIAKDTIEQEMPGLLADKERKVEEVVRDVDTFRRLVGDR